MVCAKVYKFLRSIRSIRIVNQLDLIYCTSNFKSFLTMPRKKKSKFKMNSSFNNQDGQIYCNRAVVEDAAPSTTLNYFIDIFNNKIDHQVIKMILEECDFNVDQAFDTLTSLCNDEANGKLRENQNLKVSSDVTSVSNRKNIFSNILSSNSSASLFANKEISTNPNGYISERIDKNHNDQGFQSFNKSSDSSSFVSQSKHSYFGKNFVSENDPSSSTAFMAESGDTSFNLNTCSETLKPTFIVPSVPMLGSPSPQKSPGSDANRGFWNMPESRYFSTSAGKNQCSKDNKSNIVKATEKIELGHRILVILRGLPGSGKSSLGKRLKYSGEVFSTDDFFVSNGQYLFDPYRLSEAHEWNRVRTKKALEKGVTPIIIDNTNVEAWEIKPYVIMGKKYDYEIIILEPDTPWKFNVNKLAQKNKHGVPKFKLAQMKERYDQNITVEKILACRALFSSPNIQDSAKDTASCADKDNIIKSVLKEMQDHQISLKAIIHTEDNSSTVEASPYILQENSDVLAEKINAITCEELEDYLKSNAADPINTDKATCSLPAVTCNLDELRVLATNDSGDSVSCNSASASSQEISGWEAITEHDDDFRWTASSDRMVLNSGQIFKSYSADNLNLSFSDVPIKNSSCSNENISMTAENNCMMDKPLEDMCKSFQSLNLKKGCDSSSISNISEIVNSTSSSSEIAGSINSNLDIAGSSSSGSVSIQSVDDYVSHPQTTENVSKTLFSSCINDQKFCNESEWLKISENDAIQVKAVNLVSEEYNSWESVTEHLNISKKLNPDEEEKKICDDPKPQRSNIKDVLILNNFSSQLFHKSENSNDLKNSSDWDTNLEEDEGRSKTPDDSKSNPISNASTPKPQRQIFQGKYSEKGKQKQVKKRPARVPFLNLSLESLDTDWTFPPFVQTEKFEEDKNVFKKPLVFKMATSAQTEPRDFAFCYKLSSRKDESTNSSNYKIINARPYTAVSSEIEKFKVSNDLDNTSYSQVLTFDKSTSTDDLADNADNIEISQKLAHLQECFPDISKEDLLYLLDICRGSDNWVSNLLIDWGYTLQDTSSASNNMIDSENSLFGYKNISESFRRRSVLNAAERKSSITSTSDSDNISCSSSNHAAGEPKEVVDPTSSSETVSEKDAGEKLELTLDPSFAKKLQAIFGPVSNSGKRRVIIDLEFAKLLYEKWKNTVQNSENQTEDVDIEKKNQKSRKKKRNVKGPEPSIVPKENSSFAEIMDMELALQLHKEEKLHKFDNFSTKMKRLELYNMFPGADPITLDEIFENNNYSLKKSLSALGEDIDTQEANEKKNNVEKMDACIKEWGQSKIFQEFENGDYSDWVYKDDTGTSAQETTNCVENPTVSTEASELRETAAKHFQLRDEYMQKARTAYTRGMKDVASFYSQQGSEEGRIAKNKNKQASSLIAQERNIFNSSSKLDLHGLHTQEALCVLDRFLRKKKLEMKEKQLFYPRSVSVITGRGVHSAQKAKLLPAVLNYLKSCGFGYSEPKPGHIEVTVLPE